MQNVPLTKENVLKAQRRLAKMIRQRRYQQDPVSWYVERFGGRAEDIDWTLWGGYDTHQWDGTKNPFQVAWQSLADWKSVGIESGTSTGKTFFAAIVVYWFLDAFDDSLVVTTAPKQQQLKSVLWAEISARFKQFKRIRPRADMFSLRILPDGSKVRFGKAFNGASLRVNDDDMGDLHQAIGVVSGVGADESSATKMQGYHRKYMLFIVEECAGVPPAVMTAIKNTCTGDFNVILSIGNPDSVTDALHLFCELNHVVHVRISAYDHPNVVKDGTVIHGAVTKKSIEIRKTEYGVLSNLYLSRVRGIAPKQAIDSLILYDWIVRSMVDRPEYLPVATDHWSFNALGMDVANSVNGDAACLAWGRDNELQQLHEFQCPNANHLAHNVCKTNDELAEGKYLQYNTGKINDFNIHPYRIGVDAVGVGIGAVNEFVYTLGLEVQALQGGCDVECVPADAEGKPLYKFRSFRAQMWFQARLDLMNGTIRINLDNKIVETQLIKELTMPTYKQNDGYILIESKEEVKKRLGGKSPNLADSFVYWNWVRKDRKVNKGAKPFSDGEQPKQPELGKELGVWKPSNDGFD